MSQISYYSNTDIYVRDDDIVKGLDKDLSLSNVIDIAIQNRSPIIVKHGKGKWYLKGKYKDVNVIKEKLKTLQKKEYMINRHLYFIDFSSE